MADKAADIWGDGPSSSPTQPQKTKIRAWGKQLDDIVTNGPDTITVADSTPASPAAGSALIYSASGRPAAKLSDGTAAPFLILGGEIRQALTIHPIADYGSMQNALNYLQVRSIAPGIRVKLKYENGSYNVPDQIIPKHPQGGQIDFEGNLTNPELCILNFDATANKSGFAAIEGYSIGSIDGFRINGIGARLSASAWGSQSYGSAIYARDPGSKILRIGSKIRIHDYYYAALGEFNAQFACAAGVEAYDVGDCAFHVRNLGQAIARGCKVFGARDDGPGLGFGFGAEWNSQMDCSGSFATGCWQAGFVAQGQSQVLALGVTANNNNKTGGGRGGRARTGATLDMGYDPIGLTATNLDNNGVGIDANAAKIFFGHTNVYVASIKSCASHGILVDGNGHAQGSYANVQNNGGYGVIATKKSLVEIYNSIGSMTGNTSGQSSISTDSSFYNS